MNTIQTIWSALTSQNETLTKYTVYTTNILRYLYRYDLFY